MYPKCCPWAGRLFVLAVLGLGLGLLIGCACGSCGGGAPAEESAVEQTGLEGPEGCCLSGKTPAAAEADCTDCKDCEKCPLCEKEKAKATAKEGEKEKDKAPADAPK